MGFLKVGTYLLLLSFSWALAGIKYLPNCDFGSISDSNPRFASTKRVKLVVWEPTRAEGDIPGIKMFQILDGGSGQKLGSMSVSISDPKVAKIMSVGIVDHRQGEELGPEAEGQMIDFLFTNMGIERVEASIKPTNRNSIRAHEKLGFQPTGESGNYMVTPDGFRNAVEGREFGEGKVGRGDQDVTIPSPERSKSLQQPVIAP